MKNIFKVNGDFSLKRLIISIAIPLVVGGLSGLLSMGGMEAYSQLKQPPLSPPGWVFGVVWPILYILMGLAFYRIWMLDYENEPVKDALFYYWAQLIFNFLWSILFFGLGLHFLALIDLIILWVFILITLIKFYRLDKTAGLLLVPYLLWVTFAAYLNLMVWILNK